MTRDEDLMLIPDKYKLKQILKKPEYKDIKEIRIVDIWNHWEITIEIKTCLLPKPLNSYFRRLLKMKVKAVYWDDEMLVIEVH